MTGQEVVRLSHGGPVNAVAFGPDGRHLATATAVGSVHIWNL